MTHLDQHDLTSFLRGDTPETEAESIFKHLSVCRACSRRYGELRKLQTHFHDSWDQFLDEWRRMHRKPVLRLMALIQNDPQAVMAALDPVYSAGWDAEIIPEHIGVARPDSKESSELAAKARTAMEKGDAGETEARLTEFAELDPDRAASTRVDLHHHKKSVARLIVDVRRNTISVLVDDTTFGSAVRLVSDSGDFREESLSPVSGAPYRLAEFAGVCPGWFTVEILENQEQ